VKIIGIAYAALFAAVALYLNHAFYHDDAYITLRYARNFLNGSGIVWNPGEYVQGYTNFLHLILVSAIGRLGVDLVWASRIVTMASLAALIAVMVQFRTVIKGGPGDWLGYLPAILTATSVPMLVWSLGGLEGTLFSLLVAAGCLLFLRAMAAHINHRPNRLPNYRLWAASGMALGLGFLARPDGLVFIIVSLVALALMKRQDGSRSQHSRILITYAFGVAIFVVPYILWQASYYGDVVLNTFYAKMGLPLPLRIDSGFRYFMGYAVRPPFLPICLAVSLVYTVYKRLWAPSLTCLVCSIAAYVLFVVSAGGDHMQSFRLLLPVVPLMSALLVMSLARSIGATRSTANCITLARREITEIEVPMQRTPGHLKGDGDYVLSRRPDFIIIGPSEGIEASMPWFLSDLELSRDPGFARDYTMVRVSLDGSGRSAPGGDLTFTYYQRTGG
jgi:arabinofuranosyltransferase